MNKTRNLGWVVGWLGRWVNGCMWALVACGGVGVGVGVDFHLVERSSGSFASKMSRGALNT